jgi:hypothetical protein
VREKISQDISFPGRDFLGLFIYLICDGYWILVELLGTVLRHLVFSTTAQPPPKVRSTSPSTHHPREKIRKYPSSCFLFLAKPNFITHFFHFLPPKVDDNSSIHSLTHSLQTKTKSRYKSRAQLYEPSSPSGVNFEPCSSCCPLKCHLTQSQR